MTTGRQTSWSVASLSPNVRSTLKSIQGLCRLHSSSWTCSVTAKSFARVTPSIWSFWQLIIPGIGGGSTCCRLRFGSVKMTSQELAQLSLRLLSSAQDWILWNSEDLHASLLAGTIRYCKTVCNSFDSLCVTHQRLLNNAKEPADTTDWGRAFQSFTLLIL